jgi:uncharacterized protein (DUF1330 family)
MIKENRESIKVYGNNILFNQDNKSETISAQLNSRINTIIIIKYPNYFRIERCINDKWYGFLIRKR